MSVNPYLIYFKIYIFFCQLLKTGIKIMNRIFNGYILKLWPFSESFSSFHLSKEWHCVCVCGKSEFNTNDHTFHGILDYNAMESVSVCERFLRLYIATNISYIYTFVCVCSRTSQNKHTII